MERVDSRLLLVCVCVVVVVVVRVSGGGCVVGVVAWWGWVARLCEWRVWEWRVLVVSHASDWGGYGGGGGVRVGKRLYGDGGYHVWFREQRASVGVAVRVSANHMFTLTSYRMMLFG